MSRDKDVSSKATTAAPSRTPSVDVVGLVAGDSEERRRSRVKRRKQKKGNLSWLEGHFGKVVAISILGKSPTLAQSTRDPSSRSKTE